MNEGSMGGANEQRIRELCCNVGTLFPVLLVTLKQTAAAKIKYDKEEMLTQ